MTKVAQDWLGLDNTALIDVIKIMEVGLELIEELFEINVHHPIGVAEILAEAKELLMIHNLSRMRELGKDLKVMD